MLSGSNKGVNFRAGKGFFTGIVQGCRTGGYSRADSGHTTLGNIVLGHHR